MFRITIGGITFELSSVEVEAAMKAALDTRVIVEGMQADIDEIHDALSAGPRIEFVIGPIREQ